MKTKQTSLALKTRSRFPHYEDTADFWALYTIFAFPTAVLVASSLGWSYIMSFCAGVVASLLVLLMNAFMESRLWLFTEKWGEQFFSHELGYKLLVIAMIVLFVIESALIALFFIDGSMDGLALQLIVARRCAVPTEATRDFCQSALQLLAQ